MVCYNCHVEDHTWYANENGYTLVKCQNCGLLYVENPPNPDVINEAHTQGLHAGEEVLDVTGKFSKGGLRNNMSLLAEFFKDPLELRGSWLDIGCGHGELMSALKAYTESQLNVVGSEPNVFKQESARSRGLNVSFIEDLSAHDKQYEFISLMNVYSHLPDPPAFLRTLRAMLVDGGKFLIQTGDTANLTAEEHYRPFHLPDHLSFASESIVTGILERSGFKVVAIRKYPYMKLGPIELAEELAKIALPKKKTRLFDYARYGEKWSATNMYILAQAV